MLFLFLEKYPNVLFAGAIPAPINVPRMVNSTQIRASSGAAIIQQHPANVQIQSHPPALHPVSQNTYTPGGAQVRKWINIFSHPEIYSKPNI